MILVYGTVNGVKPNEIYIVTISLIPCFVFERRLYKFIAVD